jgi:diacylglycerol kinase (ATP)
MDRCYLLLFVVCFLCLGLGADGMASEKESILFIVNPISHGMKRLDFQNAVEHNLDKGRFTYSIVYTEYAQHATELALQAVKDRVKIVAAVGGDGTVNEVAKALIRTDTSLAIIPVGSGNGLARHLGIPTGVVNALRALNRAQPAVIDTALMNGRPFLAIAGVGFDAHVAEKFASFGKRGLFSYCQVVLKEFSRYHPRCYRMAIDGNRMIRKAFILTCANGSQYGNDCIIAPQARMDDGFLDLVVISDVPFYAIPEFLYRLRQGTLHRWRGCETHRFKKLVIEHPSMQVHLDGEPLDNEKRLEIEVQPASLKILVPELLAGQKIVYRQNEKSLAY